MFGWLRRCQRRDDAQLARLTETVNYLAQEVRGYAATASRVVGDCNGIKDEVIDAVSNSEKLVELLQGSPYAALHQWIVQSSEREDRSSRTEKELLARWKNHVDSLTEHVELLKAQTVKPTAFFCIMLRTPSGRLWNALMETDWRYPFPVGTTLQVKLWGGVTIAPRVTEIRCKRKLAPDYDCTLSMELITEVVDVPEISEKEKDIMWRRKFILSEPPIDTKVESSSESDWQSPKQSDVIAERLLFALLTELGGSFRVNPDALRDPVPSDSQVVFRQDYGNGKLHIRIKKVGDESVPSA